MHFSLIAFLILNGEIHAFKMDENLTYDDCHAAIVAGVSRADIVPGVTVDLSGAPLVCQIETGPAITVATYGEE